MARKKLEFYQIYAVLSQNIPRGHCVRLMQIRPEQLRGKDAPDGCFSADSGGIVFPKRKSGEKFTVQYTTIHEVTL